MEKIQKSSGSLSTTLAKAWGPGAAAASVLLPAQQPPAEPEASTVRKFSVEDLKALGIIKLA
jgi:hypothetical protein